MNSLEERAVEIVQISKLCGKVRQLPTLSTLGALMLSCSMVTPFVVLAASTPACSCITVYLDQCPLPVLVPHCSSLYIPAILDFFIFLHLLFHMFFLYS